MSHRRYRRHCHHRPRRHRRCHRHRSHLRLRLRRRRNRHHRRHRRSHLRHRHRNHRRLRSRLRLHHHRRRHLRRHRFPVPHRHPVRRRYPVHRYCRRYCHRRCPVPDRWPRRQRRLQHWRPRRRAAPWRQGLPVRAVPGALAVAGGPGGGRGCGGRRRRRCHRDAGTGGSRNRGGHADRDVDAFAAGRGRYRDGALADADAGPGRRDVDREGGSLDAGDQEGRQHLEAAAGPGLDVVKRAAGALQDGHRSFVERGRRRAHGGDGDAAVGRHHHAILAPRQGGAGAPAGLDRAVNRDPRAAFGHGPVVPCVVAGFGLHRAVDGHHRPFAEAKETDVVTAARRRPQQSQAGNYQARCCQAIEEFPKRLHRYARLPPIRNRPRTQKSWLLVRTPKCQIFTIKTKMS